MSALHLTDARPRADRPLTRIESSPARTPTLALASLCTLAVTGAVLRLWGVGADRLGYDEAFTAMVGRMPIVDALRFLRNNDSHPPLDYLIHAPFARAGADELLFRLPSVLCSIAALAVFAWWMRRRGVAGVVATALMAFSAFELIHGRTARMYAELELFGVLAAVFADAWLRRPRRWHAPAIGVLVLLTLLTHVSGFLLGAGLLLLPGRRRDGESWRWRAAIVLGGAGWALLWGPAFLAQAAGGHSDWIPRTTLEGLVHTFGRLVVYEPQYHVLVLGVVVIGGAAVWRRDRALGRVLVCCSLVPVVLAAVAGTVAPVLLDRALTAVVWGPLLAIGFLVDAIAHHTRVIALVAVVALALVFVPAALRVVSTRSSPDVLLRHMQAVATTGDVVATRPAGKLWELEWALGVQSHEPYHAVDVSALGHTAGFVLGDAPPTGRIWLLDWSGRPLPRAAGARCAPDWARRGARVLCLH